MSQKVNVDGETFELPRTNDQEWGEVVTDWAVAISNKVADLNALEGTGELGATGLQGETGLQGIQGIGGNQGETGIKGQQGATGLFGLTGAEGTTGTRGLQGFTGTQGIQGDTGIQGETGVRGETGLQGPTGARGPTGAEGPTGIQGDPGVQGQVGETGLKGETGIQGETGAQGETGLKGVTGAEPPNQGETGPQGVTGLTGEDGVTGARGDTGPQGVTGAEPPNQGETGIQGETGAQGETGIQGDTGLQGSTGDQGETGIQGETGAQGETGIQGHTGAEPPNQGETGIQGETGAQGETGIQGVTGAQAVDGTQGATGIQGQTGAQGETGLQGPTGAQGATGVKGEIGYTGIGGPQGETGIQGATGVQGIQGETGARGETGIQGETGVRGHTGLLGLTGVVGPSSEGPRGEIYLAGTTGTSITAGTPTKLNGDFTLSENYQFDQPSEGTLRYVGSGDIRASITVAISVSIDTANTLCSFYLYKNGSQVVGSKSDIYIDNTDVESVSLTSLVNLSHLHKLEIYAEPDSGTVDFSVSYCQLVAISTQGARGFQGPKGETGLDGDSNWNRDSGNAELYPVNAGDGLTGIGSYVGTGDITLKGGSLNVINQDEGFWFDSQQGSGSDWWQFHTSSSGRLVFRSWNTAKTASSAPVLMHKDFNGANPEDVRRLEFITTEDIIFRNTSGDRPLHLDMVDSRVGINNTSPTRDLDVNGDIAVSNDIDLGNTLIGPSNKGEFSPVYTFNGATGIGISYDDGTYKRLSFNVDSGSTNWNCYFQVIETGAFKLEGRRNSDTFGPEAKFISYGSNSGKDTAVVAGKSIGVFRWEPYDGSSFPYAAEFGSVYVGGTSGYEADIYFSTNDGSGNSNEVSEVMRITSDSKVGINNTSPTRDLEVNGEALVSGNGYPAFEIIRNTSATDLPSTTFINRHKSSNAITTGMAVRQEMWVEGSGGAERLVHIDGIYGKDSDHSNLDLQVKKGISTPTSLLYLSGDDSRVGINTKSPSHTLDISGDTNTSGDYYSGGNQGLSGTVDTSAGDVHLTFTGGIMTGATGLGWTAG